MYISSPSTKTFPDIMWNETCETKLMFTPLSFSSIKIIGLIYFKLMVMGQKVPYLFQQHQRIFFSFWSPWNFRWVMYKKTAVLPWKNQINFWVQAFCIVWHCQMGVLSYILKTQKTSLTHRWSFISYSIFLWWKNTFDINNLQNIWS